MARYEFTLSKIEIMHIIMALFALTFAFSLILFRREIFFSGVDFVETIKNYPYYFVQSLIAVGVGFILHEMSHKFVAQKKGLWAEFRAWPTGLLMAIGIALFSRGGFVFAAPGAVVISPFRRTRNGYIAKFLEPEDAGKIAIIGSIINVVLAVIFSLLCLITSIEIFRISAQVNAWLALFNMIPISLLDGAKVMQWSKQVWAGFFVLCCTIWLLTVFL